MRTLIEAGMKKIRKKEQVFLVFALLEGYFNCLVIQESVMRFLYTIF